MPSHKGATLRPGRGGNRQPGLRRDADRGPAAADRERTRGGPLRCAHSGAREAPSRCDASPFPWRRMAVAAGAAVCARSRGETSVCWNCLCSCLTATCQAAIHARISSHGGFGHHPSSSSLPSRCMGTMPLRIGAFSSVIRNDETTNRIECIRGILGTPTQPRSARSAVRDRLARIKMTETLFTRASAHACECPHVRVLIRAASMSSKFKSPSLLVSLRGTWGDSLAV